MEFVREAPLYEANVVYDAPEENDDGKCRIEICFILMYYFVYNDRCVIVYNYHTDAIFSLSGVSG